MCNTHLDFWSAEKGIEILNCFISVKDTEFTMKTFPWKRSPSLDDFIDDFYQILKEGNTQTLKNIKTMEHFPIHFIRAA